jgi:23S rRNA pseudouridine1911/1915/1917 synthase
MKPSASAVFCDNHLLVAEKPPGWLTQPDGLDTPDLEGAMKAWVKEKYAKPGAVFLHAVHRLDRPVSGLVLFARTSKALSRLNEQMRKGWIERSYIAEVEGVIREEKGVLEHFLEHGAQRALVSLEENPRAKQARLSFKRIRAEAKRTRVWIELGTGRYHQIRAQFAAIGHPIVGDARYGASPLVGKIHLHCASLCFLHPITQEKVCFKSDPPF